MATTRTCSRRGYGTTNATSRPRSKRSAPRGRPQRNCSSEWLKKIGGAKGPTLRAGATRPKTGCVYTPGTRTATPIKFAGCARSCHKKVGSGQCVALILSLPTTHYPPHTIFEGEEGNFVQQTFFAEGRWVVSRGGGAFARAYNGSPRAVFARRIGGFLLRAGQ